MRRNTLSKHTQRRLLSPLTSNQQREYRKTKRKQGQNNIHHEVRLHNITQLKNLTLSSKINSIDASQCNTLSSIKQTQAALLTHQKVVKYTNKQPSHNVNAKNLEVTH